MDSRRETDTLPKPFAGCLLTRFPFSCATCSVDQTAPLSLLGTSLVALVVPVSVGMFVNHKWPQKAKIILKVSGPCHRWQIFRSVSSHNRSLQLLNRFFQYIINRHLAGLKVVRHAVLSSRMPIPVPPAGQTSIQLKHHPCFYSTLYSHSSLISVLWVCIMKCI